MEEKIGFIGLGTMGKPMAKNLLKAGYPLTVFNRSTFKAAELKELGAVVAESPKEVGSRSQIIILMVSDTPEVEEILTGKDGLLAGVQPGSVIIVMSTILPSAGRQLAQMIKTYGCEMLDAPVLGSRRAAINATLTIVVGGEKAVYERCYGIFQVLGRQVFYMGSQGMGLYTKLCNNLISGVVMQAVCEALLLGQKAGLDLQELIKVILQGGDRTLTMEAKGPSLLARNFDTHFPLKHMYKDLWLISIAASELGLALPVTTLVRELFGIAKIAGLGEKDFSGVITVMEKLAGIRLKEGERRY
jgi:3-hydroxyisobutyrate dehydrogenase-like beta-hydroxyacid dehydrogenase